MVDLPPETDSNGDTDDRTPRWVYVFAVLAVVLVLVVVALHLTGHAPGGHEP